ncbi:MAG: response regulator [Longimicrobiales bacterium]|nr:response regulator [Longimicrobiales bacterium]
MMGESTTPSGPHRTLAGVRILVVDDDVTLRRALVRWLGHLGCAALEADGGAEALLMVEAEAPDLVLSDLNMPEMNGIEFLLEMQAAGHVIPVIAMSGGGRVPKTSLLQDADMLGAVEVIAKPFEMQSLLDAILRNLPR